MKDKLKRGQVLSEYELRLACSLAKRYMLWLFTVPVMALTMAATFPMVICARGGYPRPVDLHVNDYVKLLTTEDSTNIRVLLADLKQDTGIEAVVVTINSVSQYQTGDESIESFATNLFNTWGIGGKERNDGVLILVAVTDREVRIELGFGYGSTYNANMRQVISEHMLPSFRSNEYSRGIYAGTRAVIAEVTGVWPPERNLRVPSGPAPAPTPTVTSSQPRSSNGNTRFDPAWILILVAVIAALVGATLGLIHYYWRRCPNCRTRLVLLDEASDDVYLDSGQKLEELLESINYDVWRCPNCGTHAVHPHYHGFKFIFCPKCDYRTLQVAKQTLVEPTYSSAGKERVTLHCRHCDFRNVETIILPVLTPSEDSSSSSFFDTDSSSSSNDCSSFGGGNSSGDGASGKW